jgi:hypothetical protein
MLLPETPEAKANRLKLEEAQRIFSQRQLNDYLKAMAEDFAAQKQHGNKS